MDTINFLGIPIRLSSKDNILEDIKKYLKTGGPMYHIISLNSENAVVAYTNEAFKKVYLTAQSVIVDGSGVVTAVQMLYGIKPYHITGDDFMDEVIKVAVEKHSTVLLVGGRPNLALDLSKCYSQKYPNAKFYGTEGFVDLSRPSEEEERHFFDIVTARRPQFIFAAFGSPAQELWFWNNRKRFQDTVCMGVGGAFDYKGGLISRAPIILRKLGLEWLYRLMVQPWRIKRQLSLFSFMAIVFRELRRQRVRNTVAPKART